LWGKHAPGAPPDAPRSQPALFNATAGFVRTEAVVVTRGPYAPVLLDVRHAD
jgi:hypothetical protein